MLEQALVLGIGHAVEAVEVIEVDEVGRRRRTVLRLGQPLGDLVGQRLLARHELGLPPSRMSVPRPAMLVAIVTVPLRPACATNLGFLRVILRVQHDVLVAPRQSFRA